MLVNHLKIEVTKLQVRVVKHRAASAVVLAAAAATLARPAASDRGTGFVAFCVLSNCIFFMVLILSNYNYLAVAASAAHTLTAIGSSDIK